MHYTLSSSKIAWHAGGSCGFQSSHTGHPKKKLADALAMVNQVIDRRVTETGGSTTGDTFMFLIKAPLSRRRDRWRQLRYKLTREISYLPTLVSISLFCYLTPSHYSVCVCVWVSVSQTVCVCVCVCVYARLRAATSTRRRRPKLIKYWKWGLCSEWRSHGASPQRLDGK